MGQRLSLRVSPQLDLAQAKSLMAAGRKPDTIDESGGAVIHAAAVSRDIEFMKFVLEQSCPVCWLLFCNMFISRRSIRPIRKGKPHCI